jgi:hypothetical protein
MSMARSQIVCGVSLGASRTASDSNEAAAKGRSFGGGARPAFSAAQGETLGYYTPPVPTSWRRIAVVEDPELSAALGRVAHHFAGVPAARVVHDLAVKGAEVVVDEHEERAAALERLVAFSTDRSTAIEWGVLEDIDELAWEE